MKWYTSQQISRHITRIVDIASVACYLIEGKDRAVLLDTCRGFGNLKEYVQTLTDKEVFVILTHGHYDHTGSAPFFDEVYMNHDDLPLLAYQNQRAKEYLEEDQKGVPALRAFTDADLNPMFEKLPIQLNDGQVFDLGDIHLEMISVKGHTPGMMCALLKEEKTMFFGDACGMNVLLHDDFSLTVSEYKNSLLHLKTYEEEYDTVYRNHGSYTNEKSLLDNVIECCDLILQGKDDHQPVQMYGKDLFAAKNRINGSRADGKEGNIIYAPQKSR